MKKTYISPEADGILFTPAKDLAASPITWGYDWKNAALEDAGVAGAGSVVSVDIPSDNPEGDID